MCKISEKTRESVYEVVVFSGLKGINTEHTHPSPFPLSMSTSSLLQSLNIGLNIYPDGKKGVRDLELWLYDIMSMHEMSMVSLESLNSWQVKRRRKRKKMKNMDLQDFLAFHFKVRKQGLVRCHA